MTSALVTAMSVGDTRSWLGARSLTRGMLVLGAVSSHMRVGAPCPIVVRESLSRRAPSNLQTGSGRSYLGLRVQVGVLDPLERRSWFEVPGNAWDRTPGLVLPVNNYLHCLYLRVLLRCFLRCFFALLYIGSDSCPPKMAP